MPADADTTLAALQAADVVNRWRGMPVVITEFSFAMERGSEVIAVRGHLQCARLTRGDDAEAVLRPATQERRLVVDVVTEHGLVVTFGVDEADFSGVEMAARGLEVRALRGGGLLVERR